jgi:phage terminase large subunit-like protein
VLQPDPDYSDAALAAHRLTAALGPDLARRALGVALSRFTTVELAALAGYWPTWAMSKQRAPGGKWRSWTRLSSRRGGKSYGASHFVNREVEAGRVRLIGLAGPTLDRTIAIQVLGPSGLIATANPWCRPEWSASTLTLTWPTGARAWALTPEVPRTIRGIDFELSWLEEVQDWPKITRVEAWTNFMITTSAGLGRTVISATPQRRHPLLREIEARSEENPEKHVITRGTIYDNPHLGAGVVEDMARQIGITTIRGREELMGEMVDDADGLIRQAWIDGARRGMPDRFVRRIIACDPSITSDPRFSDRSGVIDMGAGADGQLYAIRNLTARHRAEDLGGVLVDAYIAGGCALLLIETNRGGDAHVALVRVAARERGHEVVVLGAAETPPPRSGTVYVRPINNRGKKAERLTVAAALLERLRVSFVHDGAGLDDLEDQLLSLDGSEKGPDDASDAFAMACTELSGAGREARPDARAAVQIAAAGAKVMRAAQPALRSPTGLPAMLGRGRGRTI